MMQRGTGSEVSRILDQLVRAYRGGAWHGPSLSEVLRNVDSATASRRPVEDGHTIQEICLHIAAWEKEAIARLEGRGREDLPEDEDWPRVDGDADPESWQRVLATLEATQLSLADAVRGLDEDRLGDSVPGSSADIYALLHGIVQHNLYHAGQIAILKKART